MRGYEQAKERDDQVLGGLPGNPADITLLSVPVLSNTELNFLPRIDPGLVNLLHSFEPWEALSGGAECGTATGASVNSAVGDPGAEREGLLLWVAGVGMGTVVGGGGL